MTEPTLHRYELMEERRGASRRGGSAARGVGASRRHGAERRRGASLTSAPQVRRVFPLEEGATAPWLRRREGWQRRLLAAGDAVGILAGLVAVGALTPAAPSAADMLLTVLAGVALAKLAGLYDRDDLVIRRSTFDEAPALAMVSALLVLVSGLATAGGLGRATVLGAWVALAAAQFVARGASRALGRKLLAPERCLAIGDPEVAAQLRRRLADSRANGVIVASLPLQRGQHADAFGGTSGLRRLIADERIDRVILLPVSTDSADTLELVRVAKLAGVRVSVLPRLFEVLGSAVEFEDLQGITMLGLRRFGLPRSSRAVKRAFDLAVALAALTAAAPFMLLAALLIRLDSPGPILFRQTRVGRDGRHFQILKFRTMVADAEARKAALRDRNETEGLFKIAADPRVTRVGRFLRATSLDELPQLLNVLRGDMSLVGPRPLVVDEDSLVLGLDRSRLHLTPGMTGHWQILGSARVPMDEMVGIDYLYVANWTLWTDVKILARTVPYVLSRGGV